MHHIFTDITNSQFHIARISSKCNLVCAFITFNSYLPEYPLRLKGYEQRQLQQLPNRDYYIRKLRANYVHCPIMRSLYVSSLLLLAMRCFRHMKSSNCMLNAKSYRSIPLMYVSANLWSTS